jgi:nucleotide-binding universal stress UspA family protein
MFKRILVCLDRSPLAEQVLPYAIAQAEAFKATLYLIHVLPEPFILTPSIPGTSTMPILNPLEVRQLEQEQKQAEEYIETVAQSLRERNIDVETVVIQGEAGPIIVEYARQNDINLIAIATHGHGGLRRVFYGSVAEYILKNSGLPVLLIRVKSK